MQNKHSKHSWFSTVVFLGLISNALSVNAATFQKTEDLFINIGTAFRVSFSSISDAAPDGKTRSNDVAVEEARLYTNGKVHKNVSYELNISRNTANNNVNILDAHVGLELNNHFNFWIGRFLPPASRASASAPLYPPTFDFPLAEQAPNQFSGRDDGVLFFGTTFEDKFKYMLGAFRGRVGLSNQADNPSYALRLQYNFWDAEPGFYNIASYDGAKSILSIGSSVRYQADGAGTFANRGDYVYWNIDGRLEKALGDKGVIGAEASYYNYDNDHTFDVTAPGGNGYFGLVSYTFPQVIGIGKIQPKFSYQGFDNSTTDINVSRYDIGLSYLINGSNIRIDTFYFNESRNHGIDDVDGIKVIFHLAHFF